MKDVISLLNGLGSHFSLVIIGCIELAVAAVLAGTMLGKKAGRFRKKRIPENAEDIFLEEFSGRTDECCIVMENRRRLPIYSCGNLEGLLGVTLEEIQRELQRVGEYIMDLHAGRQAWQQYLEWDGIGHFVCEIQRKDERYMELSARRSADGVYDLVTVRDNTENQLRLEDYESRLQNAEEISLSKTTFLSRMSHEIRTPMNGIIGMLTLAEGKLAEEEPARKYLDKAGELSDHLLSLINDILDMSRIEAGKVELEQKAFSLRDFGQTLYDMFAENLKSRGIRYAVNFEEVTEDYVIGDELRLSQVIINFLSNAVKFTEKGEITVTFRQMMLKSGVADLMIRVHDTGKGMEAKFINRIFRPFEQETIEISHKYGGTGLGMAITDSLVRLMGGEIVVESTPGKGSDFSVFLHLPVADNPEKAEGHAAGLDRASAGERPETEVFRNRRILLAEDNELNALITREILENAGAAVEIAPDGRKAVESFAAHPENYYDFILMDIQMPEMDGREAARTIRALNRPDAGSILIFGLSADAFVEDERLSLESGMNGHYAKPVDYNALRENVGRYLREKEQG